MDENKNIDLLREQGWDDMSVLLDAHMPQETNRRPILWYWLAGAAAVLISVAIPLALLVDDSTETGPKFAGQEQLLTPKEESTTNMEEDLDSKISSVLSDPTIVMGKAKDYEELGNQVQSFSAQEVPVRSRRTTFSTPSKENESEINGQNGIAVQKSPTETLGNGQPFQSKGSSVDDLVVSSLYHTMYSIKYPDRVLAGILYDSQASTEIYKSSGRIKALVFAESMWSLTDRFGFVNVGPGVKYVVGKWTMGLSGGLAMPLPTQKSFYSSNLPFSNQFNFSSADAERIDYKSPSFAGSASAIYYEKYSMKPGVVFGLSVQRLLTHHWGVGVDLGRIGFRYDFTQKAEPNQNIAANTDLTNLQNKLWYGGLSVNYQLGDHWIIHGGARFINLLNVGDVGVLPAVHMEYGF